jgi:hypothetical protein
MYADKVVALMNVVERSRPLKRTIDPTTNPEPLTVMVAPGSPALTLDGEILLTDEASSAVELLKKPLMSVLPDP